MGRTAKEGVRKTPRILPSFLKGLRIFQDVATHPNGRRLTEVAKDLGVPASNATLYLNTLVSAGFLVRDPLSRTYVVSPAAIEWLQEGGGGVLQRLMRCAKEPMEDLHQRLNENVLLAVRKDRRVSFVRHLSANRRLQVRIEPDPDYPLHITAAGRAILAFLPEREIEAYIRGVDWVSFTSRTVTDVETLQRVLEETRAGGIAFNSREYEDEIMALAAPICVADYPVASLVVQFPAHRYTARQAKGHGIFIRREARRIEQLLAQK